MNVESNKSSRVLMLLLLALLFNANNLFSADVSGDLMPWHKVVIQFTGPESSEIAAINPFTDYRVDVVFTGPSSQVYNVPGFFAVDGNAGESSAEAGDVWQVNFTPDEVGEWSYAASFVMGENIAADLSGGNSAGFFDGETGVFTVELSTAIPSKDFRTKGKLSYVNDHYLQFQGNGEYFIKGGANSPEVLLQYAEFDNTNTDRLYPEHIADWNNGDPTWKDGKGKGIIGSINYLTSIDVNSFYFLTMNAYGDGKEAWPWLDKDSIVRYDCSKLEQWDVLFRHMNTKGMMVHFVLSETENEAFFESSEGIAIDGFANSRKIYYREMVARFGYLPAVTWNIGEENGWAEGDGYHTENTDEQRIQFSDYLRALTYYNDHVSIHNGPSTDDHIFEPLLGVESLTGPAFQWDFSKNIFDKILEWRDKSAESGHKWVINLDEPYVNPPTGDLDDWRTENVWATYMAGGAGIELYIGSGLDVSEQNFRQYEDYYLTMSRATNFLKKYVSIEKMVPDTDFSAAYWTLRNEDDEFLIYCKNASNVTFDLPANNYRILWFNPRKGGAPTFGSVHYVDGGDMASVGVPLNEENSDWVCLITKQATDHLKIGIAVPEIQKNIEAGSFVEGEEDIIDISIEGEGTMDTLSFVVQDGEWLRVEMLSILDGVQKFSFTLNENVSLLPIGDYNAIITFLSDNTDAISVNYRLQVLYNLQGHKYYYIDNKIAIIEAEATPIKDDWEESSDQTGFSGTGCYVYNAAVTENPTDDDALDYFIYVPQSATYILTLRTYNASNNSTQNNDVWIKMDDCDWLKAFTNDNLMWSWDTHFLDESGNTIASSFELNEGFHHLKVHGNSAGFLLDKIHLYQSSIVDIVETDSELLPSGNAEHNQPLIDVSRGFYKYSYTEGSIPNVKDKTEKLSNVGTGELEPIYVTSTNEYLSLDVSGEGNSQELKISFTDSFYELTAGDYTFSIVLACDNASTREIKFYFHIKELVGLAQNELKKIALVSNIVSSELVFKGALEGNSALNIYNTAGALVYSNKHFVVTDNLLNVSALTQGVYLLVIQNKNGYFNERFIKK